MICDFTVSTFMFDRHLSLCVHFWSSSWFIQHGLQGGRFSIFMLSEYPRFWIVLLPPKITRDFKFTPLAACARKLSGPINKSQTDIIEIDSRLFNFPEKLTTFLINGSVWSPNWIHSKSETVYFYWSLRIRRYVLLKF